MIREPWRFGGGLWRREWYRILASEEFVGRRLEG
nr:unnamed protein product [Callosobruchus analis]